MVDSKMVPIPAGSLFTVSTGEYSDYTVQGFFRALREVDAEALKDEWFALHPEQAVDYNFRNDAFLGWVAAKGLIEPVDCFEWHLADYGRAADMRVSKLGDC